MQFTDLPLDIIDHILTCIPDLRTLAAAILTSKAHIYSVFQSHKLAILTSVAFNLVGPSLPHAVAAAVSVELDYREVKNADFDERMATAKDRLMSLSGNCCQFLESSITVTDKLEDIFSQMYKDRRSTNSVLTNMESLRFRRALYRIWLLTMCVSIVATYDDNNSDANSDDGEEDENLNRNIVQYLTVRLLQFDKPEVVQLVAVTNFLRLLELEVMQSSIFNDRPVYGSGNYILSPGHIHHMVLLKKQPYRGWQDSQFDGIYLPAFHSALSAVCPSKQLDSDATIAAPAKSLLDSVVGEEDACSRCGAVQGLSLIGRTSWHRLSSHLDQNRLTRAFPGNFRMNTLEVSMMRGFFFRTHDYDDVYAAGQWTALMEDLFDFEDPEEQEVWDKEALYCTICINKFFDARFPKWWFTRRNTQDLAAKEKCWYGWNCRTQVHKPEHAMKLNHLCAPVRDDGKSREDAWGHLTYSPLHGP